jgi:hypothetical protein
MHHSVEIREESRSRKAGTMRFFRNGKRWAAAVAFVAVVIVPLASADCPTDLPDPQQAATNLASTGIQWFSNSRSFAGELLPSGPFETSISITCEQYLNETVCRDTGQLICNGTGAGGAPCGPPHNALTGVSCGPPTWVEDFLDPPLVPLKPPVVAGGYDWVIGVGIVCY